MVNYKINLRSIITMEYGISVEKNQIKVVKRIIIPGLSPTQVTSGVAFGMTRPEWVKCIINSMAKNKLDLSKPNDRYELVHNETWGLLFQALSWKREAYEKNEPSGGYGIGFLQLQSNRRRSYGVFESGITADKLCRDVFNDILTNLNKQSYKESAKLFARLFSGSLDQSVIAKKFSQLSSLPMRERKEMLLQLYVYSINEILAEKFGRRTPDLLTIPHYFIDIVRNMGITTYPTDNEVLSVLCYENPGHVSRGLMDFEIAALLHEFLRAEKSRPIALSFAVFDLVRGYAPFNHESDVDLFLRDSFNLLPDDTRISQYLNDLHSKIVVLLKGRVRESAIFSKQEFVEKLSIERIKQQAIIWEFNLVLGQLEEMLRKFIAVDEPTPYVLSFEKAWNRLLPADHQHYKEVIWRFFELCSNFFTKDSYIATLRSESGFSYKRAHILRGWFEEVNEPNPPTDLKTALEKLIWKASEVGDSIEYDGKKIKVETLPDPINPLITRGAIYSWCKLFTDIWRQ